MNLKQKLKQNKYIILTCMVLLTLIGYSFYQYYKEQFSYAKYYYLIKENCYERKNVDYELCTRYHLDETDKYINEYIKELDPKARYEKIDAITLSEGIIQHTLFDQLQMFFPLIILITFIGTIHSDFSSGIDKNYLLRMKYKDYLKRIGKIMVKISLITPICIIIIFVLSMLFTRFNFNVAEETKTIAVYDSWKYNNIIIYGIIICLMQFLINILYCNIGLYCCKNNRSRLIAIFMGYIIFLAVFLFVYIVVYAYIINKLFLFENLSDYFNIAGFWYFSEKTNIFLAMILPFILAITSSLFIYKLYQNKERVIIESEKQVS